MNHSLRIYGKYMFIGAIVGVSAVIGREIIAMMLPEDTPTYYALSVAMVYLVGILASYWGHRQVTFSHVALANGDTARSLGTFSAIAVLGLVTTTVFSVIIRYALPIGNVIAEYKPAISFALATLITSVLTFYLNGRLTFRGQAVRSG